MSRRSNSRAGRALLLVALGVAPWSAVQAQCPDGRPVTTCAAGRAPATKPAPPPRTVRARRMMLLPFRNVTRGAANEWLVSGVPLMLGQALGQFTDLMVVPDQRLIAAMR